MCWLGFVLTTIVVNNAYTFRKATLTAIDAGHWLGVLVIIGAILGAWRRLNLHDQSGDIPRLVANQGAVA